jgi:hypothetical protein
LGIAAFARSRAPEDWKELALTRARAREDLKDLPPPEANSQKIS